MSVPVGKISRMTDVLADLSTPEGNLGHYTTANAALEYILPTMQLRMSPYSLMRDPVENKVGPSLRVGPPMAKFAGELLGQALLQASEIHQSARLLSMTRDSQAYADGVHDVFGCAWARPRLWEQYAEHHRGVCLVFGRNLLEEAIGQHLASLGIGYYSEDVEYAPGGYAMAAGKTLADPAIFDPVTSKRALEQHIHHYHRDFFFLKNDDFATEREYRVVSFGHDQLYGYVPYRQALRAVIAGEAMPAWQLDGAAGTCQRVGVPMLRIQWLGGRPTLTPHDSESA
jgi:hypothetical protein